MPSCWSITRCHGLQCYWVGWYDSRCVCGSDYWNCQPDLYRSSGNIQWNCNRWANLKWIWDNLASVSNCLLMFPGYDTGAMWLWECYNSLRTRDDNLESFALVNVSCLGLLSSSSLGHSQVFNGDVANCHCFDSRSYLPWRYRISQYTTYVHSI